jgi:hypothetical protein
MTFGQKLISRYLPPLILVAVTLSVFAILQNKGPRGTVRQFFEVAQQNNDAIYSLMVESTPVRNGPVEALRNHVKDLVRGGFTPETMIVEEQRKYIIVIVNYVSPQLKLNWPVAYVLERRDGTCKISAAGSIQLQNSL